MKRMMTSSMAVLSVSAPLIYACSLSESGWSPLATLACIILTYFPRRVYTILLVQLASTAAVAAGMKYYNAQSFLIQHTWIMFVPLLGALGTMVGTAGALQMITFD